MFKKLLSDNRIFGALVCGLVFIAAGLLYLNRVKSQSGRAVQRTQETVKQIETAKTEGQPAPGGHYHPDGTYHAEPHRHIEVPPKPVRPREPASTTGSKTSAEGVPWLPKSKFPDGVKPEWAYQALRDMYSPADGNPPGFNVPEVNLWDFQETQATYESNLAFYIANSKLRADDDPEVNAAHRIMHQIVEAANPLLGIFTPEECEQIHELKWQLRDFMGIEPPRYRQLMASGYTEDEALEITIHEDLRAKGYSDEELFSLYPDTRELMERYWHQIGRPSNEDR